MILNPLSWSRSGVDGAIVVVHGISCASLYGSTNYLDDRGGLLLFIMEMVTIAFHFFYWLSLRGKLGIGPKENVPNLYKWLEYR